MTTDEANAAGRLSRRTALKVGAGVAAGAVVWAEPTIKGLARRPAYGQIGSPCVEETGNFGSGAQAVPPGSTSPIETAAFGMLSDGTPLGMSIIIRDNGDGTSDYCLSATPAGVVELTGGLYTSEGFPMDVTPVNGELCLTADNTQTVDLEWFDVMWMGICPP